MTEPFDPKKSYLSVKASEGIIAFVGFKIHTREDAPVKEGVLKIAADYKAYGGGSLTLTFIVDTEDDEALKNQLGQMFGVITENVLRKNIGSNLDRLNKVSLDTLAHIESWYVQEISAHFRVLKGEEKTVVEQSLLPALEKILPFSFLPVEWWPALHTDAASAQALPGAADSSFLKGFFQKLFK
jgi:hypothetical protein